MPDHIQAFASDGRHHDLTSPNSLHDAWLKVQTDDGAEIKLRFLGPQHDRYIDLHYRNVSKRDFGTPGDRDDLLVHELRALADSNFAHEFVFASGATMLVEFSDFEHSVIMLSA